MPAPRRPADSAGPDFGRIHFEVRARMRELNHLVSCYTGRLNVEERNRTLDAIAQASAEAYRALDDIHIAIGNVPGHIEKVVGNAWAMCAAINLLALAAGGPTPDTDDNYLDDQSYLNALFVIENIASHQLGLIDPPFDRETGEAR